MERLRSKWIDVRMFAENLRDKELCVRLHHILVPFSPHFNELLALEDSIGSRVRYEVETQ